MRASRVASRTGITLVLAAIAVLAVYPLFFMVITSLKDTPEYLRRPLALPASWVNFDNFSAMLIRFDIVRLYANSIGYIAIAWVISLVVVLPAAFAFAKFEFPARRLIFMAFVGSMAIPAVTFIIPDYVLFSRIGIIGSPAPVIIMWATTSIPGSTFLLSAFMRSLPSEVLEAAKVDGAGYFRIMRWVVLPMSVPGIITMTIFQVTGWWNDLLTPLIFLQDPQQATMTLGVATTVQKFGETDTPFLVTGLLMAAFPPVLTYVVAQRYIRSGLVLGALR